MPLALAEIAPGAVAYFDHVTLLREKSIDRNDDGLDRPGPFICVELLGDRSVWCAITTQWNPKRLYIAKAWRRGGDPQWRHGDQYLVDGLNTYLGLNSAFVSAAAGERAFSPHMRPTVISTGVAAIVAEIKRQGGPLLSDT